jgi:tetratricopeptide (TPR) repeat protein
LASAGGDQTVRVWDAASGKELLTLKGHTNNFTGVVFSPDGRRLASAGFDQTVRVWEALDVPETIWRQRALLGEVDSLYEKLLVRDEVQAALRNDATLDEADRKFALEMAETHTDNPEALNAAAWKVVTSRDAGKPAYARALRQAEAAIRLIPKNRLYLNTLGTAQYRARHYADALTTLSKSEKLNATKDGSHPADLAFLAMAQHQLGKKDEAKAMLDRLRTAMKLPSWAGDDECKAFLREAEELIEGKTTNKKP